MIVVVVVCFKNVPLQPVTRTTICSDTDTVTGTLTVVGNGIIELIMAGAAGGVYVHGAGTDAFPPYASGAAVTSTCLRGVGY
jgi:hypothetical protein